MGATSQIEIDLSQVKTRMGLHSLLQDSLRLPGGYGANWNAFWELICECDVLPERLVLRGWSALNQRLPREAELMLECFGEYSREMPDRAFELVVVPPPFKPFICPCCGHHVFDEPPGSYDVCPVCFWEDDALQLEFATTLAGGANKPTLEQAQVNFVEFGASEERLLPYVRPPSGSEPRDPSWRIVDRERDSFEDFQAADRPRAPHDANLYYWRSDYWRRPPPR